MRELGHRARLAQQQLFVRGRAGVAAVVQAAGELSGSLAQLREIAAASVTTVAYEPTQPERAGEIYDRFLRVTGLNATPETKET